MESSLRLFFRVLARRKPEKIFESIFCKDKCKVKNLKYEDIRKMTKLSRRSWKVRVLRYGEIVHAYLFELDPETNTFKRELRVWIEGNIPPNGDFIFRGKVSEDIEAEKDWLVLELEEKKRKEDHNQRCQEKIYMLDDQI